MKYAILALFFAVNAKAGIPAASQPGGSSGIAQGSDFNGDDIVAKTLQSTGTAPSLTATGIVAGAGSSITATGFLVGVGGVKAPHLTAVGATFGGGVPYVAPGAADLDLNGEAVNIYSGGSPRIRTTPTATIINYNAIGTVDFQVKCDVNEQCIYVDASGENVGIGIAPVAGNGFQVGASSLVIVAATGNLGIGTASPGSKLHVSSGAFINDGTGAGITSSGTIKGRDMVIGSGVPFGRALQTSDFLTIGLSGADGTDRNNIRFTGNGYNSTPSNSAQESVGDKLVFFNDNTGKTAVGNGGTYDMWFQANGHNTSGIAFWTSNTTAPFQALRLNSTGGMRFYSRSIGQLLAIAPAEVGEVFICNNCSPVKAVVSTGTSAGNFAAIDGGNFQ